MLPIIIQISQIGNAFRETLIDLQSANYTYVDFFLSDC